MGRWVDAPEGRILTRSDFDLSIDVYFVTAYYSLYPISNIM